MTIILEKFRNSVDREMTKQLIGELQKGFHYISEPKYILITNKHVNTGSFQINVKGNHIDRALSYKYCCDCDEKLP